MGRGARPLTTSLHTQILILLVPSHPELLTLVFDNVEHRGFPLAVGANTSATGHQTL